MPFDPSKVDLSTLSQATPGEGFDLGEGFDTGNADKLRFGMGEALKINPAQHAETMELSKETGVPGPMVEGRSDQIKRDLKVDKIDFARMEKNSPKTAGWIADFNNAVIAQDDVSALEELESVLTPVADVVRAFVAAPTELVGGGAAGLGQVSFDVGRAVSEGIRALGGETIADFLQKPGSVPIYLDPAASLAETGERVMGIAKSIAPPEARQNFATMVGGALGQIGGYALAPSTALTAFFSSSYKQGSDKARAAGADDDTATATGMLYGLTTLASEKTGMDLIFKRIPPAIRNATVRRMVDVIIGSGLEGAEELIEGVTHQLISKGLYDPEAEIDVVPGAEEGAAAAAAGIVRLLVGGKLRAANGKEAETTQQSELEQTRIDQIDTVVKNIGMKEHSKEALRQFASNIDGESAVFIDGAQAALYLQTKTPEEIRADAALTLIAEQTRDAAALGGDVQIPMADFVTDVAGTAHFAELRETMTLSGETVSPFRQEQVKQESEKYMDALVAEAELSANEYTEAQDIFEEVREQLIDSGQINAQNASVMAKLVPAWATAQASRTGKTVQQVYEESGLSIVGPLTGEKARLVEEEALAQPITLKDEGDVSKVETGRPVTFPFIHNTESATGIFGKPQKDDPYGRDVEPSARFVTVTSAKTAGEATGNLLGGTLTLNNPLVIPAEGLQWKSKLSEQYGGKTGKALSKALIADGYDGIITTEERYISEVVDFTTFEEAEALYQPVEDRRVEKGGVTPVAGEQRVAPSDRRTSGSKARALFDEMTRDELIDQLLKHELTGIKGRKAFVVDVQYAKAVASVDADSLKWINDNLSPDHGDALLQAVADALDEQTEGAYHVSGDEFYVLGDTEAEVKEVVDDAIKTLSTLIIEATKPDGTVITLEGLNVTHGIGASKDVADQRLKSEKVAKEKGGLRAARGQQPSGAVSRTAEGVEIGREKERLAQPVPVSVEERDLFVAHNLSAENILAAEDLGGLAAPSLAVARAGVSDLTGFGEVTLLADPKFLEDPKARTFDADIYSPRQPRAVYDIDQDIYGELYRQLDPDKLGLSKPDIQSLEDTTGADNLLRSTAVEYHWLNLQNKAPKLKRKKVDPLVRRFAKTDLHQFNLIEDIKFIKAVTDYYQKQLDALTEGGFDLRVERMEGWYFEEDGSIKTDKLRDMASEVNRFRETGGKDVRRLHDDIAKKMRVKGTRAGYEQWVTEQFNSMVTGKKLFKGFTPVGNRKYVPYNMQNVVKDMTQQLQAGENFFYGAGTVRSKYANEMKTIKQIQAKRDEIVSEDDMNQVKLESGEVFQQALEDLKPFYKFESDSWGYADDAGNAIIGGRRGLNEAFNMTPEAQRIVDDLLEYLVALPTSYFEAKVQRDVGFEEFDTAVVPRGMRKDALQILKDAGLNIRTYDPKTEGARAEVITKQQSLLFQRTEGGPVNRGYYEPANSIIRLTEASNLSTFLHEFAHFMYEKEVDANSEMLQDTNKWFRRNADAVAKEAVSYDTGITILTGHVEEFLDTGEVNEPNYDKATNKRVTGAIRRAVHEQFARGFETYLMEGKAPSVELRNAFRAFARWMTQIYNAIRGDLNVDIDAEMRQVFDRLLATDEQIQAAEGRAQVQPMFTDAAMAGMTDEEFASYQEQQEVVKDVQTETLRDKIIKQLTRATKRWWKEEKQDLVDEEVLTLQKEKVYASRERLKSGDFKLDHATVKEMVGEEKTDKLGRTSVVVPPAMIGLTVKGKLGVHPDEAAGFLGYGSGAEMIDAMIKAPAVKDQAEVNAEARMVEAHGDILNDGTIEREADDAIQSEERGKLILKELKALAKNTNAPTIDRAAVKELAAMNIGKLSFREIHPAKYRRAEVRAANEAGRMLAEGNREGAAAAKLRQVMNYYLGMEATNAKNETMKIVDRMARYNKKKVREEIMKAENGYWDQLSKILARFEFRKSATLKQVESLNLWAKERMESDGDGLVLSNVVLDESYVTHWKNIPFADLQGVSDSVKNIEHVARYANKIQLQQEEIDFKKLKSQWVEHIKIQDERFPTKESRSRTDDSRDATAMEHIRRWASQLTKVPFLASWLDGGERAGMSHDVLVQVFTDALDAKIRMVDDIAAPVIESIGDRSKADQKRHNTKIWIPEIGDSLMGHQVLAVALNVGNQGNLKKLLLGEGWADPEVDTDISIDNQQLQAVLQHMTESDWTLVQGVWDQMELLYPMLAEVHRRTTGLTPPKVVPTEIIIPAKVDRPEIKVRGGYYPVKYSPVRSHKAEKNAEKREAETESMFNNTASIQSSVNAGATNERTGFYDRIHLSMDVIPDHFNETIHYITHHDAVRQTNRLIQSPDVASAISGVLGESEFKQLKPWLNDIAKDGRQQPVKTYIDSAFNRLRFGTTLGIMGFKASTGIMQLFGILTTAAELGTGATMKGIYTSVGRSWYMNAVRKTLGSREDMQTAWDFAVERSKVMSHRAQTMDREIRSAMSRLKGKKGIMAAVQETSMKHIALIQTYMIDLPTWHAAYQKELSESGDEAKARKRADWSVENLQGSGATKDMATIMRAQSKIHTTFTMFMTFFSSLGNLGRDLIKGRRTGIYSPTSVAAKLMFLYTLPVFFEMLMRGELDGPEDEDERLSKFATATALYPLTSIPFVRDVASGLIGDYGYNSSPVASMLEKGIQGSKQILERAFTDEEMTESAIKNTSKVVAAAAGIPGINQVWATGEHLYDVLEDGEDLTGRELIFGPDRN